MRSGDVQIKQIKVKPLCMWSFIGICIYGCTQENCACVFDHAFVLMRACGLSTSACVYVPTEE